jgi:hypothetical protein
VAAALAAASVVCAPSASAVSDGVPDVNHPNVGALLLESDPAGRPGELDVSCSGALLSPRHFLTAAHCLGSLEAEGYTVDNLAVTFDQDAVSAPTTAGVSAVAVHPHAFRQPSMPYDIGVVTLAEPVAGLTPISLPTERLLDRAAAQGGLRGHSFVNVGYGYVPNDRGRPDGDGLGLRRESTSPFAGLTLGFLRLLMRTDATGEGGSCFGDSGSPKLFEPVPGAQSNLVVAITTGGDRWCRAQSKNQRLDLPAVRAFLDHFVAVP